MLGYATAHKPDAVTGAVRIARQNNELAGERVRTLIKELLSENDRLKGKTGNGKRHA